MVVKRWLAVLVAGLVLAAGAVSALVVLGDGTAAVATDAADHGSDKGAEKDADKSAEKEARDGDDRDTGPPPWAHGHKELKSHGPGAAWKALSSAQRSALMERLATEHAQGMKAFGRCVAAGRTGCEKPLPPGHAKRL